MIGKNLVNIIIDRYERLKGVNHRLYCSAIPARERQAVWLYIHDHTPTEIAYTMRVDTRTVYKYVSRVKNRTGLDIDELVRYVLYIENNNND